ncbi:hypothetical protein Tco_0697159 [Tanacetum coccineum]
MVPSDDEVPIEEQTLPDDSSPTALSPGYVTDYDLEEDPEEDPAEYPIDGGYNDDEDEDDDDDEVEEEDKEEEEHLALANSTALHIINPVSSAKDTKAFETDESAPTPPRSPRLCRARISVRPQTPMEAFVEALITEYAVAPTPLSPSPSPLTPLSSPLLQISSPPLPLPSPPTHTSPTYYEAPLGYRAAMIMSRAASPPTHHLLEIPSPPLFDVEESLLAAAARQTGHTLAHRVDYGFIDTMDASIRTSESRAMTAMGVVNKRVTDLATT